MKTADFAKLAALAFVGASVLSGCNVGNAPYVSPEQVETNFKQLDPQEQIRIIQSSPAPGDRKEELIRQIEKQYGVKRAGGHEDHGTQTPPSKPVPSGTEAPSNPATQSKK